LIFLCLVNRWRQGGEGIGVGTGREQTVGGGGIERLVTALSGIEHAPERD